MIAAGAAPIGGHLAHVILFAAWFGVVVVVLLVDHVRSRSRRGAESAPITERRPAEQLVSASAAPVRVSMATWPPAGSVRTPLRVPRAPRRRGPVHEIWLPLAVAGSLAAAAVHLVVMPQHIAESYWYGAFFAGAATVQTAFAYLLSTRPRPALLRAGAAGNAATILLWTYTRVVGVPIGPDHGSRESVGRLDVLATTAEALVVLGCILALVGMSHRRQAAAT